MKYSFTEETPLDETLARALRGVKVRRELADALGCEQRPLREYASLVFVDLAARDPQALTDFEGEIIDALDRPESLTRYSMLEVLRELCPIDAKVVQTAFEPIQDCLYDEDSGNVRLCAFRLMVSFGMTTPARSLKVWDDLSMALRCYHGDAEFIPMVNELLIFLDGKVDRQVKDQAAELFAFDAGNAKGTLRRKAEAVMAFAPEVIERLKREAARKEKAREEQKRAEEAARIAAAQASDANDDEEE